MRKVKTVDISEAIEPLADYARELENGDGAVVVTEGGRPVAVMIPADNVDLEDIALSTDRKFIDLIERSRSRHKSEGGISSEEMRRRLESE